jgi:hypothetical protein
VSIGFCPRFSCVNVDRHNIYFARVHPSAPTLQKYRYLAKAHLLPPLGPPICLRYAVWAVAASTSDKFSNYQEVFYQRARKYAEADEMKAIIIDPSLPKRC